jgi:deoxyadenosine/deoxycytidine kinase
MSETPIAGERLVVLDDPKVRPAFTPIIWTESIIGGGKTTLCKEVGKRLDFHVLYEPVAINPYIEKFYRDPKRWAFPMQIHLMVHRFGMKKIADYTAAIRGANGIMLDRCVAGDRVFAKLHRQAGNISELEWDTYEYAYQILARDLQPPTVLLYLDVQAETAFARVKARGRGCEENLSIDYLRDLRAGYEELIQELKRGLCPWAHSVEVVRLVWDRETVSSSEWDAVAATVADACKRG